MTQRVTNQTIHNPQMLRKLLEAMDTEIDTMRTLINELRTDHGSFRTSALNQNTKLNEIRAMLYGKGFILNSGLLAIDTNFDIKNTVAIDYIQDGIIKTLAINTNFDTGAVATWPAAKWGIAALSITDAGAANVNWATNSSAGFDSEALAIAGMPTVASNYTCIGYATILAHAANSWTAGSDALQGGAGGNPSPDTNYYNGGWNVVGMAAMSSDYPDSISAAAVTEQVEHGS